MAQQVPQAAPVLMSLLQWSVSKFRVSTQIESVLDQAIGALKQQGAPQPQQPSPLQMAEVEEKKAGAAQRMAKAKDTNMDAIAKEAQLRALGILQPQPQLPPAAPQMPPVGGPMQ
jgi:hypothetical protein